MSKWTKEEEKALLAVAKKCGGPREVAQFYPAMSEDKVANKLKRLGAVFAQRAEVLPLTDTKAVQSRTSAEATKEKIAKFELEVKHLLTELRDRDHQIETLSAMASKPFKGIVAPSTAGKDPKRRIAAPVALFSDWHVEEPVRPETVNGLNEYNLDIAAACIVRCAEAYEWFTHDKRFDMQRNGVIWLGGDHFSGYIHEELMETCGLSPVEAVVWLQGHMEDMLRKILRETQFEVIDVVCNDGNHGRTTHKIRVSTRTKNSYEWLLFKTLARRFKDEPRLRFHIAEGEWEFLDIYEKTFAFTHGDSFRYLGGVGGLLIPVNKGIDQMRKYKNIYHTSMGHFHTRMDLPSITVNGSMIGTTPYGMHIHAAPERRQQSWFLVDSKYGKCLSAPIILDV